MTESEETLIMEYDIAGIAARELVVHLRAAKRQLILLSAMGVPAAEMKKLLVAMGQAEEAFRLFRRERLLDTADQRVRSGARK